ncbi:MAG: response regulator transcription factor [Ignavibacteriae bacterium]|nr:response regulator transcription factor [Ignavibacteriota bacterium]
MTPIKVACVEDNTSLRKRFEEQFEFFDDIQLVATFATGEAALNALRKSAPSKLPDIVLMDIELPGMSGIDTTIAIKELFPDIDVMMFTVFEDELKIFHAIQAGAAGYLLKDDPIEDVAQAIRELHAGGAPMSQSIARTVLSFLRTRNNMSGKDSLIGSVHEPVEFDLSVRELELLQGLVQGETYQTLAKKLFISPHTVKTHIKNIYKKLHVHSRALAVRVALDRGLV